MKAEYTFEKTETEDSYAATYYLTENGQRISAPINIPTMINGAKIIRKSDGRYALVVREMGRIGRPRHIPL